MKLKFTFLFIILINYFVSAQNHYPYGFKDKYSTTIKAIALPKVDVPALIAEDAIVDKIKDIPYRFGHKIPTNFNLNNSGQWLQMPNGDKLWQLSLQADQASSINLLYKDFYLPKGATLFIYSADKKSFLGPFTSENNHSSKLFATSFIFSDKIIVEYYEPQSVSGGGSLTITDVVYGYRPIKDLKNGYGSSGFCQNNINCPIGNNWQNEKRSVVLITVNGNAICTGSLLNNVPQDTTPLVITAAHCGNPSPQWVFHFNYESANCNNLNGSLLQTVTGASSVATYFLSDFNLLLLNNKIPASYVPYFNGWDRSNVAPDSVVTIHHPSGDIKKISVANNQMVDSTYFNAQCWKIAQWSSGCTEPGSSGAPLFNKRHLFVGQLKGGPSFCGALNEDFHDYFGKFSTTWDSGLLVNERAKEWLDPMNINPQTMNSFDPYFVMPSDTLDAALDYFVKNINRKYYCDNTWQAEFFVKNKGAYTIKKLELNYQLDYGSIQSFTLNNLNITSNFSTSFLLPDLPVNTDGMHILKLMITKINDIPDNITSNNILYDIIYHTSENNIKIEIKTDDFGSENYWRIKNLAGEVLARGGPFNNNIGGNFFSITDVCLPLDCYIFSMYDAASDGMTAAGTNGYYKVYDNNGNLIIQGASFNDVKSDTLCIIQKINTGNFMTLSPNPTLNKLYFFDANKNKISLLFTSLKIYNLLGSEVLNYTSNGATTLDYIDVASFAKGFYILKFTDQNNITYHSKFEKF